MPVDFKYQAPGTTLRGTSRCRRSGSCVIADFRGIHLYKCQTLVRRQRSCAVIRLAMRARAAAAAPDLQTLVIHLLRGRKGSAARSILCPTDIKHQIQGTATACAGQTDFRIGLLTDPAARKLRCKGAVRSRGGIFQGNGTDKFRIRAGRIKRQNVLPRLPIFL